MQILGGRDEECINIEILLWLNWHYSGQLEFFQVVGHWSKMWLSIWIL